MSHNYPQTSGQYSSLQFIQGDKDVLSSIASATDPQDIWQQKISAARERLSQALNARHVSFLLGSGASSHVDSNKGELGIPTMAPLAAEFLNPAFPKGISKSDRARLLNSFGLDLNAAEFSDNLETLMGRLLSLQFGLGDASAVKAISADDISLIGQVITRIRTFLVDKVTNGAFTRGDRTVLQTYERFFRRLVFRERSLPRPWIFTTNYDLFNEQALDLLGIMYSNGFSGTVDRRFNPTVYRYALAEELDVGSRKWSAVDSYIYLCKLHGSVNWVSGGNSLYPVRELSHPPPTEPSIIYPTPAKQGSTLGSPYAELFRQFQEQLVREQSVLFIFGYSFGDEHINNIIYQALSIPTFRLVIFSNPDSLPDNIARLRALEDPRIWILGGESPDGDKLHYFSAAVTHLLPDLPSERIDRALQKFREIFEIDPGA